MAQRSPYNDRYKVEQKGKTRKSAAGAKPKRAVADLTPAEAVKKSQKKTSAWGRAKKASSPSKPASARFEATPRMKQLRQIWWLLWGGALLVAVGILIMQQAKIGNAVIIGAAWLVWLLAMGGAFYIEFVPIRKERALAIEAAKSGGKPAKPEKSDEDKPDRPAKPAKPVKAAESDDSQPPSQDGPE
jgi:cation transport ATPase